MCGRRRRFGQYTECMKAASIRLALLLLLVLLTAIASGCGNKGELVRPTVPARG